MKLIEYEIGQAKTLLGGEIVGVLHDPPRADNLQTPSFGLVVNLPKNKTVHVWIDCDPEGNGPGHLSIEPPTSPFKARRS